MVGTARVGAGIVAIVVGSVLALATVSACGSSGGGRPAASDGSDAGSDAGSTTPDGGAGTPTVRTARADAATTTAVTTAYKTFFSSASTSAQSEAVLQNGSHFAAALKSQGSSSFAAKSSVTVQAVRTTSSPDTVAVTFTVLSDGQPLLRGDSGYAVRAAGTWQVAAQTFCGLLGLEGDAPSACADKTLTALPD
jgi:hypothetical protein